jgi:hypothetical protein
VRATKSLVNTVKSRSRALACRGDASPRGHRPVARANSAFYAAMFVVDLIAPRSLGYFYLASRSGR